MLWPGQSGRRSRDSRLDLSVLRASSLAMGAALSSACGFQLRHPQEIQAASALCQRQISLFGKPIQTPCVLARTFSWDCVSRLDIMTHSVLR